MLLSQPWRVGLTALGIGFNAYTVLVHTTYGFTRVLPMLRSHKSKLYDIIGICFQHLMILPTIGSKSMSCHDPETRPYNPTIIIKTSCHGSTPTLNPPSGDIYPVKLFPSCASNDFFSALMQDKHRLTANNNNG